jgi:type IV secretory pathway VirB2 component (pilin)
MVECAALKFEPAIERKRPMVQAHDVSGVANQVEGNPAMQAGARVGYAISGVLHLLIAWIALQIAWTASGKSADQSGALQSLAGNSLGRLTLWVAVLGFLALGLWQLASALSVRTGGESSKWAVKAKGIAKAVVYLALAWTSFSFAKGQPSSSKTQSADFTATLLQQTGGRLVVALIGVAVIGVGIYHVKKGWTKKFLQDLAESPSILATRAGVVGYVAKGVALAVVGVLFVSAAAQNSAGKATGLDGALRSLRQQAFGPWLLTAVALGIAAYGLYSFARARHARV